MRNLFVHSSTTCLVLMCHLLAITQVNAQNPREMFEEARELSTSQKFAEAAEILTQVNELVPDNALIQFNLGYNLHAAGKLDEAIPFHEKAAESENFKPTALYNLACAYSIKNEKDKAFDYLKQSIVAGFRDEDQVNGDPDLKNIQTDARFNDMINLIRNDGKLPEKGKAEELLGSWKVESGMRGGSKVASDRLPTIKITKKDFTIPSGEGGEPFVMSYKLDMEAKPITVDFNIESGPVPSGEAKGIIKMKNGKMILCYKPMGERPEKFESTEENGCFLFEMKKEAMKTEAKAKKAITEQILGDWKCQKGVRSGEEIAADRMASTISIDKDAITIPVGPEQAFVMSYKIDESISPATIDMTIEDGPAPPGSKAIGIIKMDGAKLLLCYDSNGIKRPEKFEASQDGLFYFEMSKTD
ncbi:MAG: TIGR03067 domain-containing protein [Planctomycetota bacterium]